MNTRKKLIHNVGFVEGVQNVGAVNAHTQYFTNQKYDCPVCRFTLFCHCIPSNVL